MASEATTNVIMPVIASVITAVLVGMASSYLTATTTMVRMDEKMLAMTDRVEGLEASVAEQRELSERLVRLEGKLDAIIERLDRQDRQGRFDGPSIYAK